ncbi:MAG TPA: type I-F CRISPR-associated protein Csy1 [Aquabacterium sp.]|nr:type I-F CRISPR-associated protein Csy1 [Aquabacterium sp.]
MNDIEERGLRFSAFRSAIVGFIEARREAKLKGLDDDGTAALKYDPDAWLADAARRVAQIQAVTHVLKATHPDARGSSLHAPPDKLPDHAEIGSHTLGAAHDEDVVGNAAALDVFKFLKVEVEGRRLLDWMQSGDAELQRALHADPAVAQGRMAAFCSLVRAEAQPSSHGLAKQVYWLVGNDPAEDGGFHLLQPMFSSSLAHAVHASIQDARFGDEAKAARDARRNKLPHDTGFAEYQSLAVRKLGGSKPQNISQLNSERGGVNYLLASLPPRWRDLGGFQMLGRSSAIECVAWLEEVRGLKRQLIDLLQSDPDPTMDTRLAREAIERALGAQLPVFTASVRERHAPGWTRAAECELPLCEQLWLDPERTELPPRDDFLADDLAFNAAFTSGAWTDQVAERFGHWVNGWLREAGVSTVGDAELRHWAGQALVDITWPAPLQRHVSGRST